MKFTSLPASARDDASTSDSSLVRVAPSLAAASAPYRGGHLALLDGLRAFLACWVLVSHAMWLSGYESDELSGVVAVLCRGAHAVDLFVLLSGFVIFKLLDSRRESYGLYVFRRFLRLYPVYILLFLLAIPTARIAADNLALASQYFSEAHAAEVAAQYRAWLDQVGWHVLLHALMLHGIAPGSLLPGAPGAFLEPAWSVSLEWQFYLLAPAAYKLATSRHGWARLAVSMIALSAFALAASGLLPHVDFGAALPFHAEYFYLGALSYFFYKRTLVAPITGTPAAVSLVTALFIFQLGHRYPTLIPLCLWLVVLGLLFEHGGNPWVSLVTKPLLLPFAQFAGRISYSLYLCHMLLLYIVQYVVLRAAPDLTRAEHCCSLIVFTLAIAVPASALLYRYMEEPAMRLGRALSERAQPRPAAENDASLELPVSSRNSEVVCRLPHEERADERQTF